MEVNKFVEDVSDLLSGVENESVVMVGGFGRSGSPVELLEALRCTDAEGLTIISNNAGHGDTGIAGLILDHKVSRVICSYPISKDGDAIRSAVDAGEIDLEVVPQGTLAERIRCGGSGLGGVLTPSGLGTEFGNDKSTVVVDGEAYLLESALIADYSLISANIGDRWGNLQYRLAQRNFNGVMANAAKTTVAQVRKTVELGDIPPDNIHTPGVVVDAVYCVGIR